MSSFSEFDAKSAVTGVAGGGEVRTYRGRTVEELIPRIRAELGEGAIILRERQGLTGGVGGFFAQRCVEIQAQAGPRVSVYAGDDQVGDLDLQASHRDLQVGDLDLQASHRDLQVGDRDLRASHSDLEPETPQKFDLADIDEERELDEAEFEAAAAPASPPPATVPAGAVPPPATVPAGLPAVAAQLPEVREFAGALRAAAVCAPELQGSGSFNEHAPEPAQPASTPRPSFRAQPVAPPAPAFEPVEIAVPVAVEPADAPVEPMGPFRVARAAAPPVPAATAPPAATPAATAPPAPAPAPPAAPVAPAPRPNLLAERLAARGMTVAFAEALTQGIADRASLEAHLTAILPTAGALPLHGGAIAVVGSGGTGKTRFVAALAAAAARAGHHVSVARLGAPERQLELAELLRDEPVEVLPAMRTRATARAVASAREQGLVVVDTTSASPTDRSAMEVLAETLEAFAFDGVLLTVPATFTPQAAGRLADGFAALPLTGLVATHADESGDLGAVAELAIRRRLAVGHVHCGLDVARAAQTLDPARLAGQLLR
jgi:flagellar biosynthesis GTPase FlhF